MLSMLDSELKRFHDRVISPYDYSIYFRIIDLALATIIALIPLAIRDVVLDNATFQDYSNGAFAVMNFMIVFGFIGQFQKLYDSETIFDSTISIRRFIQTTTIAFFILLLISAGLKSTQIYSRFWFFSWMGGYVFAGIAIRILLLSHIESQFLRGNALRRALVVTIGQVGQLTDLSSQTDRRFRFVGHLELANLSNTTVLESMARRLTADMIIVEAPWRSFQEISEIVSKTFWSAVQDVYVVPVFDHDVTSVKDAIAVERIGNHYLFKMKARPIGGWNDKVKRLKDIAVSVIAIVLTSPILVAAAIAIKLTSRGPVLFRQVRQGFAGETFEVWKFRTMYTGKTDLNATRQTTKDDPRVTPVGRFLRRSSIDELPQFFNVLEGSMSVSSTRGKAAMRFFIGLIVALMLAYLLPLYTINFDIYDAWFGRVFTETDSFSVDTFYTRLAEYQGQFQMLTEDIQSGLFGFGYLQTMIWDSRAWDILFPELDPTLYYDTRAVGQHSTWINSLFQGGFIMGLIPTISAFGVTWIAIRQILLPKEERAQLDIYGLFGTAIVVYMLIPSTFGMLYVDRLSTVSFAPALIYAVYGWEKYKNTRKGIDAPYSDSSDFSPPADLNTGQLASEHVIRRPI